MEYSSIFVCLMGMGTVFFGLICLIALTYLMSAVVGRGNHNHRPCRWFALAPLGHDPG